MKRILICLILTIICAQLKSQDLSFCQYLYNTGYWKNAENAYIEYINTLEPGSRDYYVAISYYGELAYFMDKRQLADSLLKQSSDGLALSNLFKESDNERQLAVSRYYTFSHNAGFKEWGISKISRLSFNIPATGEVKGMFQNFNPKELLKTGELSDYRLNIYEGRRNLQKGLTLLAKLKFDEADWLILNEFDSTSVQYADMLMVWINYYYTVSNCTKMLAACDNLLRILKSLAIDDGVLYADAILYSAIGQGQLGNHKKSLELYAAALRLYEDFLGTSHSKYAWALYNQGKTYKLICQPSDMLECEQKAAQIFLDVLGDHNAEYAAALNEIGSAYSMLNDTASEFKYYDLALESNRRIFGEGSLQTASQYYNISIAYAKRGNYSTALSYIKKAQSISLPQTSLRNAFNGDCQTHRAYLYNMLGQYKQAVSSANMAVKSYARALGTSNPRYAHAKVVLGNALYGLKKYDEAAACIAEAVSIDHKYLVENFSFMTSQVRSLYWESSSYDFSSIIKLCWQCPDNPAVLQTAYNCELISKGIKLSSELEFSNIIKESGNKDLIAKYSQLQDMRQIINSEGNLDISERSLNTDSLGRIAIKLEQELVDQCQEYGDMTRPIKLNFRDIQNCLGDKDLAVEFLKTELDAGNFAYGVLVLRKGWKHPEFVSLFSSSEFDSAFASRYKPYTSTKLYEMVWKPIEKYFEKDSKVYFSPAGLFFNTAIEYAPIDDSLTIADKYKLFRISSTRNLVNHRIESSSRQVAVYGGIYYDTDTTTMVRESALYQKRDFPDEYLKRYFSNAGGINVNYLKGTDQESKEIVAFMQSSKYSTLYFTKDKANEESFKSLSGKNLKLVHIATHGFYLDGNESLSDDDNLLFSGLLMSGCNNIQKLPSGIEDGILTAREISYLDFRKTDMVVLSACETALGKVTDEGVYGLQRGFKKAGVNTIVMSLWPVNDFATKVLMTGFYRHLVSGDDRHTAFLAAQRELRAMKGVNPTHWAAFIMLDGQ